MFKISLTNRALKKAVLATTLTLSAIVPYSSRTLASEPPKASETTSQPGCLSGYPNGTYQGDRSVTRNEFAAGLNACLNQVNQLIPPNRSDLATREDFEVLIKRQKQLNEQLRELNEGDGEMGR